MEKYTLNTISSIQMDITLPCVIFLYWDLWAGKTTLTQHIIRTILKKDLDITSPTYTYYNKIENIYHFDLYRLSSYDEFIRIGGEEIIDNNEGIIIVEWPNILEQYHKPDIVVRLNKTSIDDEREIEIEYIS